MMIAQIYIHGTDGLYIFNYTAFKLTYIFKLPLGITFLLVVGRRIYERAQSDIVTAGMGQQKDVYSRSFDHMCCIGA